MFPHSSLLLRVLAVNSKEREERKRKRHTGGQRPNWTDPPDADVATFGFSKKPKSQKKLPVSANPDRPGRRPGGTFLAPIKLKETHTIGTPAKSVTATSDEEALFWPPSTEKESIKESIKGINERINQGINEKGTNERIN